MCTILMLQRRQWSREMRVVWVGRYLTRSTPEFGARRRGRITGGISQTTTRSDVDEDSRQCKSNV